MTIAPPRSLGVAARGFLVLALCSAGSCHHIPAAETPAGVPEWMNGVWMREWIRRASGETSPLLVRYVQARSDFGDVRIPVGRPSFAGVTSFAEASDEALRALARQNGFAGSTSVSNLTSTWHHELDFQPDDPEPDIGRLERSGDAGMYEHALDSSYVESWRSITNGDARFMAVRVFHGARLNEMLVVAGDYFYYGRNRAADLPKGRSLTGLIDSLKPNRATLLAWLDCELSFGRIRGGRIPWEIEHSTLPWREGRALEFAKRIVADSGNGALHGNEFSGERWQINASGLKPADAAALFPFTRVR